MVKIWKLSGDVDGDGSRFVFEHVLKLYLDVIK